MLSHIITVPDLFAELLDHVKRKLMKHIKECELAMTEIHQYYHLPFVNFNYTDDMLVVQISIYVKKFLNSPITPRGC